MRFWKIILAVLALGFAAVALALPMPAAAQVATNAIRGTPLRVCQATLSGTAIHFSGFTCATFTGSGSGTTLTTSAVTGTIMVGDTIAGTGVTAGTTIVAQLTGTAGGAGTYQTSVATTSSTASLTAGGVPANATLAYMTLETANARWKDDGVAPTTSVGMLFSSATTLGYAGVLTSIQFIAVTGSPVLDVAFYRSLF